MDIEERIFRLENEMIENKADIGILKEIIKQLPELHTTLTEAVKNFSSAMTDMKITMSGIQGEMKNMNTKSTAIENKIDKLEGNVRKVDEKGKIDIIEVIKENIVGFLLGGGLLWIIQQLISNADKLEKVVK